jgi:hypothetical protein
MKKVKKAVKKVKKTQLKKVKGGIAKPFCQQITCLRDK